MRERRFGERYERRERQMILMAIDQHLDAALYASGFFNILVEFLDEVRVRIAQYFRVVRILRQTVGTYAVLRYEPNEPRIFSMPVADEHQRNRSRRVERRKETAHRVGVEGDFPWFDRMFHTVNLILSITKNRSALRAPNGSRESSNALGVMGEGFPETRPPSSGKGPLTYV